MFKVIQLSVFVELLVSFTHGYNFKCPSDGRHFLLPHETNCAKFYYCEYGSRRNDARDCPKGTLFAFDRQICDWPHMVKCTTGNTNDCNNGTLPNGCPADFTVRKSLPHETDCGKYYCCVRGAKNLLSCPSGKHFNAKLEICDDPANAGCSQNNNCNNGTLPNGCPADFKVELLLKHETDCDKYYQCVHGNKVLRPCAPGTHFHEALQKCNHPSIAQCDPNWNQPGGEDGNAGCDDGSGNSNPPVDPPVNPPNCSCQEEGGGNDNPPVDNCNGTLANGCPANFSIELLLPHETDCDKYYQCVHGKKVLRPCAPGTHFHEQLQICNHPWLAKCDPNCNKPGGDDGNAGCDDGDGKDNEPEDECKNGTLPNGCPCPPDTCSVTLLPHETDCDKYYCCFNGEKQLRNCPSGLHFNNKLQKCDTPENAGCAKVENKCADCHVPFWRHDDCDKFWRCVDGNPILTTCPDGLAFNQDKQTCDFKCNVQCTSRLKAVQLRHFDEIPESKVAKKFREIIDEILE